MPTVEKQNSQKVVMKAFGLVALFLLAGCVLIGESKTGHTVSACITYQGYVSTSHYKHLESFQLSIEKQYELNHLLQPAQLFQLPRVISTPRSLSSYPDDGSPYFIMKIVSQGKSTMVSINTAIVEPSKELTPFLQWLEKQTLVEGDPGRDGCRKLLAEFLSPPAPSSPSSTAQPTP